jgi:spermidine/putrescine transport system substrate-binding protein
MKNEPLDPQTRALISAMSRRRVLQAGALGGVAAFAAACGVSGTPSTAPSMSEVEDLSDTEKIINWSTWIDYIDIDDDGNRPTLEAFTAATGITVNYNEDYNDNNEFLAKVKPQLDAGQSIDRDIVTPTDWMAGFWIAKGYAQKLDKANIPNSANMGAAWAGVGFDPNRDYSLPWQSGFAGLGWNRELLKELTGKSELRTVEELWAPELKGRITILSEMRDSVGVVLMSLGLRADDFTDADFEAAIAVLQEQVDSGQIRQVTGNDYKTAMANGEVAAAIAWSGDMLNDTETYGFSIPESGGTLWTDNMIIPIGATHKKNAEKWMDFYFDPINAARVAAYVNYICPVEGAQEAMADVDPSMVDNPAIFPDAATLAKVQTFMSLSDVQQSNFEQQFQSLAGA